MRGHRSLDLTTPPPDDQWPSSYEPPGASIGPNFKHKAASQRAVSLSFEQALSLTTPHIQTKNTHT